MNILMTGQVEIPAKIGMGTRMWEFSENLKKQGNNIFILCSKRNNNQKSYENINGIKIYRIKEIRKPTRWLACLLIPQMTLKIIELCRRHKIDIIHGHVDIGTFSAILAKPFMNSRIIYDMHGFTLEEYILSGLCTENSPKAKLVKYIIDQNLKKSDKILAVSEYQKKILSKKTPSQKIEIIPNGANLDIFRLSVKPINIKHPAILHVGLLEGWAGGDTIIKSTKHVIKKYPNCKFIFVGGGPKLNHLKKMAKDSKIDKNIIFTGHVPYTDVPKYIKGSDICLIMFPKDISTDIASPIKVFEYMAMQKPIVSPKATEVARIIRENKCGIITKPNDKSYSKAIIKLIENKKECGKMGKNSRQAIEKKYNWRTLSKELESTYKSLLS